MPYDYHCYCCCRRRRRDHDALEAGDRFSKRKTLKRVALVKSASGERDDVTIWVTGRPSREPDLVDNIGLYTTSRMFWEGREVFLCNRSVVDTSNLASAAVSSHRPFARFNALRWGYHSPSGLYSITRIIHRISPVLFAYETRCGQCLI